MTRKLIVAVSLVACTVAAARAAGPPIDWDRLGPSHRRLVDPVLATSQVSREVGNIVYSTRRAIWEYLLVHPDFAAQVARAVRQGKYRIQPVGDHYDVDDGHGVRGVMRPLYSASDRHIFYLEGAYEATRWLPTVAGRVVLVLDNRYLEGADGRPLADVAVTGYIRIDSRFVGALLLLAKEFSGRTLETSVRRFFRHVERLNRRALDDPKGLLDLLDGQPEVDRAQLAEFRRILLPPARHISRPHPAPAAAAAQGDSRQTRTRPSCMPCQRMAMSGNRSLVRYRPAVRAGGGGDAFSEKNRSGRSLGGGAPQKSQAVSRWVSRRVTHTRSAAPTAKAISDPIR